MSKDKFTIEIVLENSKLCNGCPLLLLDAHPRCPFYRTTISVQLTSDERYACVPFRYIRPQICIDAARKEKAE